MLVEVRPLPEKKWHGKSGKDSFAQPKAIEVLYDPNNGVYATGLTPEETAEYGKKLGVDLSNRFDPAEPHPFWSTKAATIKLENFTQVFNTDKPIEYVKVKNLKASKFVANSQRAYDAGEYPDATHVIFDEEEEVSLKATKVQMKQRANIIASKMSNDDKAAMVQILSSKTVRKRSADFIDVEVADIIENKTSDFIRYAGMGREEVNIRALVLEMLNKNILTKEAGSVYYMGELIGIDYEGAVEWFKNPQNSKLKVAILEKVNG